ncbi:MAG: FmdB family zinc ribbon protein [Oligoflexales bacterium]
MPLYEFECKNCGGVLEKLMKISDSNPEVCESCQGGPLVKLMSRTNFVLKGQGWYETDFKHNGKNPKPQKSVESDDSADKSASTKSEGEKGESSGSKEVKTESKPSSASKPKAKES